MTHYSVTKLASAALIGALFVLPTTSFAKGPGNPHAENHPSVAAADCTAFGHLIAPGWLKHHPATTTAGADCALPFGIGKILGGHGGHGTTTTGTSTDTTAPMIFFVNAKTGTSTASITWVTNERSSSQVLYGTSSAYSATTSVDTNLSYLHHVTLTGLTPATTYHFAVRSADAAGNVGTSADKTFTTGTVSDTTAPVVSGLSVGTIASTSAAVSWNTNEAATSKVYYGTSTPLNLATAPFVSSGTLTTAHSVSLTGLAASTTYQVVVESTDASGNTATSSSTSFVTLP